MITVVKITEGLDAALTRLRDDGKVTATQVTLRTLIAGIPYVGGAALEVFGGLAQRRAQERVGRLFDELKDCMEQIDDEKIDRAFLESKEVQTILFLLLEKIHTTHDEKKLKMFGTALANSACIEFKNDDKELFARVLRDLSLGDLTALDDKRLKGWFPHVHAIKYSPDVLSMLSRLEGMGLVRESLRPLRVPAGGVGTSRLDAQSTGGEMLAQAPEKSYHLTGFGERFLRFVSGRQLAHDQNPGNPAPA